jgi:hypothetical protein
MTMASKGVEGAAVSNSALWHRRRLRPTVYAGFGRSRAAVVGLVIPILMACDIPTAAPRFESTLRFPTEDLAIPVTGTPVRTSATDDLTEIDLADDVRRATVRVSPENPSGATGQVAFTITGGGATVQAMVDVAGARDQSIEIGEADVRALLGSVITLNAAGTICPVTGCGPVSPPFPTVTLKTVIDVVLEIGGTK